MKWTKELLRNKCILVNTESQGNKVFEILNNLGFKKWSNSDSFNETYKELSTEDDSVIVQICNDDDYFYCRKNVQQNSERILYSDLFPEKDLKSKLVELFSKPETIFYLRSKEEAGKLDKLLKEINYLDRDYTLKQNILFNWYTKDERDHLSMIDIYNARYKDLTNLDIIEITFDNLLDHVK